MGVGVEDHLGVEEEEDQEEEVSKKRKDSNNKYLFPYKKFTTSGVWLTALGWIEFTW